MSLLPPRGDSPSRLPRRDFLRLAGAREMRLTHDGAIVPALPSPSPAQAFVH